MAAERVNESPPDNTATDDACVRAYSAFGLHIASTIALPSLSPASPAVADVTVCWGRVPVSLETARLRAPALEARNNELLLRPPGVPRILIRGGCEIVVDRDTDERLEHLESWLSTSALGALLHQRGLFPLHASAIAVEEDVVLFTGDRGAGKSTLMSALAARGHACAADDVVAITLPEGGDDVPLALPGLTRAKLWSDSADLLGIDLHGCPPVASNLGKHLVTWPAAPEKPRPIRAVYVLRAEAGSPLQFVGLSPVQAVEAVLTHTYRPHYASAMGISGANALRTAAAVARQAHVVGVRRPVGEVTVQAIADRVIADVSAPAPQRRPRGEAGMS